jgi:inorganic pyrophosphatase
MAPWHSLLCVARCGTMHVVMENSTFWQELDRLVAGCDLVIDRPRGTPHPRYPALIYPLDYGYLDGTRSGDGDGIDVWIGSLPERRVTAVVCTVDVDKRDAEIKILLGCTPQEVQQVLAAHNSGAQAGLLVERPT